MMFAQRSLLTNRLGYARQLYLSRVSAFGWNEISALPGRVRARRQVSNSLSSVSERSLVNLPVPTLWLGSIGRRCTGSFSSTLKAKLLYEFQLNPVVIFSLSHCKVCAKTKERFKKLGVEPAVFELDLGEPHEADGVQILLREMTGGTSLPCVFIGGNFVPGRVAVSSRLKSLVEPAVAKQPLKVKVLQEIALGPVVVFSKSDCPLCSQVQETFQDSGVDPIIFHLDKGELQVSEELHAILAELTGVRSLPYVFIDGSFVGGSDDSAALAVNRKFLGLVEEAAAAHASPTSLKDLALHEIQTSPVVIFALSSCPYCAHAKQAFQDIGVEPIVYELDRGEPLVAHELKAALGELVGERSLPLVFVGGTFIGGGQHSIVRAAKSKLESAEVASSQAHTTLKAQILHEIETNPLVLFSRSECAFCAQVKHAFQRIGLESVVFEVDRSEPQVAEEVQSILAEMTGGSALPCVFVRGSFVGGIDDTFVSA